MDLQSEMNAFIIYREALCNTPFLICKIIIPLQGLPTQRYRMLCTDMLMQLLIVKTP